MSVFKKMLNGYRILPEDPGYSLGSFGEAFALLIGRFSYNEKIFYGIIEGAEISVLEGSPYERLKATGERCLRSEVKMLAPCRPTKAVCVGLNYQDHAAEFGQAIPEEPVIFLKPSSAVIGPGENIICPPCSSRVDYEAELAVVIGKTCRNVSVSEAFAYIFGYTCGNDITARDLQEKDSQWTRSKSFDTFLPLGPYIVRDLNPQDLVVSLRLNGELKQYSATSNLIFSVPELVSFISGVMTLFPGDVIMTGTPSGVGPVLAGDEVEVEIEGIGVLNNGVRSNMRRF